MSLFCVLAILLMTGGILFSTKIKPKGEFYFHAILWNEMNLMDRLTVYSEAPLYLVALSYCRKEVIILRIFSHIECISYTIRYSDMKLNGGNVYWQ